MTHAALVILALVIAIAFGVALWRARHEPEWLPADIEDDTDWLREFRDPWS